MIPISLVIEALFVGMLAATTMIYAFQTKVSYPRWMMTGFEHPWVLFVVMLSAVVCFKWMPVVAVMVLLIVIALWMDNVLFAKQTLEQKPSNNTLKVKTSDNEQKNITNNKTVEIWPFDDAKEKRVQLEQQYGPALANVPVAEPNYPTFFGADIPQPGPAPFL